MHLDKKNIFLILTLVFYIHTAFAKDIQIITSFYPLSFLIENIAPPSDDLDNLTDLDPHKFSPSPQDIIAIQQADLFIYFSQYLEFWADVVAKKRNKKTIAIEKNLARLFFKTKKTLPSKKTHKQHHFIDTHLWLDAYAMSQIASFLGAELAKINPQKKKNYLKNAKKLTDRFLQTHQNYQSSLKNCLQNTIITTHNFLGYLSRRYNFEIYPIKGSSTLDKPSAKTILFLKKIAQKKISYILIENTAPKKWINILLQETSLKTLSIDNLAFRQKENYFERAKHNLQSLQKGLNCKI